MSRALCLFAIAALFARPALAADAGGITGVVEDALLHPLANATVLIHDASGNTIAKTTTDKDGHFTLADVPFGDYTVEASSPGLVSDHQHVQIQSPDVISVELVLVNTEEVIQIHEDWAVPEPTQATGSVATVGRQELAELPGGDTRPITQVMSTQPGFVEDALGNIYVRGHHGNVQYQIDGIPVPDSVGSMFAASIPVRLVQSLEMASGGMPAEYGYRLGAVVNLVTRSAGDNPEGSATVRYGSFDTVEPGIVYATKPSERTGMVIGGSFSYSQRALDPPSIDPILHDRGITGRGFARLDFQPCEVNRYELFAMYAHNDYQIPLDPALEPNTPMVDKYGNQSPPFVPHDTDAREREDEAFAALAWTHKLEQGQVMVAPIFKLSRGALFGDAEHALGPTADPGATASDVTRTAIHAGAISTIAWQAGSHQLKIGVQADALAGTTAFTLYTQDGATSGTDRARALLSGAFAQDHVAIDDVALDFGVRVDELHVAVADGAHDAVGASPRLGASYAFTKDIIAHVFGGVMWMPPQPLDAASAARVLGVVPADANVTYDLKPETDLYSELGIKAKLDKYFSGGLVGWGRYAYNQLDDTSIGSTSITSNYNFRRGRAAGLEADAELRVGPWLTAFANGSLGIAQGRGIASAKFLFDAEALADDSWQLLDHAQTWTANAGATVRDGRYALTGLLSYGSGLRTGPANDQHVPGHVRADVSSQYTFVTREYPIRVGLDIINVTDARYAYRIGNGFVGSSYGAPRSVFLSLSIPLAPEPHHGG